MTDYRIYRVNEHKWLVEEQKTFLGFIYWRTVKTFKTLAAAHYFAFPDEIETAVYGYWV